MWLRIVNLTKVGSAVDNQGADRLLGYFSCKVPIRQEYIMAGGEY